jgi:hypothetical protein
VIALKTEGVTPFLYLRLGIIPRVIFLENPTPNGRKAPVLEKSLAEPEV